MAPTANQLDASLGIYLADRRRTADRSTHLQHDAASTADSSARTIPRLPDHSSSQPPQLGAGRGGTILHYSAAQRLSGGRGGSCAVPLRTSGDEELAEAGSWDTRDGDGTTSRRSAAAISPTTSTHIFLPATSTYSGLTSAHQLRALRLARQVRARQRRAWQLA